MSNSKINGYNEEGHKWKGRKQLKRTLSFELMRKCYREDLTSDEPVPVLDQEGLLKYMKQDSHPQLQFFKPDPCIQSTGQASAKSKFEYTKEELSLPKDKRIDVHT